jgi:hypothetical protein
MATVHGVTIELETMFLQEQGKSLCPAQSSVDLASSLWSAMSLVLDNLFLQVDTSQLTGVRHFHYFLVTIGLITNSLSS